MNRVGNVQLMQKINRVKVFDYIRQNDKTTRPAIAAETGLSLSSITNIVTYLLERKLICEKDFDRGGHVGRKASLLGVNTQVYRMACVTIEAGSIRSSCVDLCGKTMFEKHSTSFYFDAAQATDIVISYVKDLFEKAYDGTVAAIALSVPGVVMDGGRRISSMSMKWKNLDLKTPLENHFGLPVFVQNSSIARAMWVLSEARRDAVHVTVPQNAAFLDLERGIGVVHFTDNQINPWFLGEIGHTTVDSAGEPCFCGNIGCLESLCSPERVISDCQNSMRAGGCPILMKIIKERSGTLTFTDVIRAAGEGDEDAARILQRCGEYLGICITNILNLLSPSVIYMNGHQLLQSGLIVDTGIAWAAAHSLSKLADSVRYVPVDADDKATLIGLTEYALDHLLDVNSDACFIE